MDNDFSGAWLGLQEWCSPFWLNYLLIFQVHVIDKKHRSSLNYKNFKKWILPQTFLKEESVCVQINFFKKMKKFYCKDQLGYQNFGHSEEKEQQTNWQEALRFFKSFNDSWGGPLMLYFDLKCDWIKSSRWVCLSSVSDFCLFSFTSVFSFCSSLIGRERIYVKVFNKGSETSDLGRIKQSALWLGEDLKNKTVNQGSLVDCFVF